MIIQNINNYTQNSFQARIKLKPTNPEKLKNVLITTVGLATASASALEAGTSILTNEDALKSLPDNYVDSHNKFMNSEVLNFNTAKTAPFKIQSIIPPFLLASSFVGISEHSKNLTKASNPNINNITLNTLPYLVSGSVIGLGASQIANAYSIMPNDTQNQQMINDTKALGAITISVGSSLGASLSKFLYDIDICLNNDKKKIPD